MVRKAKSESRKRMEASALKTEYMRMAVEKYKEEKEKAGGMSMDKVIAWAEGVYQSNHPGKKRLKLSKTSLSRQASGSRTIQEFNETKRWLSNVEEDKLVTTAVNVALQGFPLSHRRLEEHANDIAGSRLGESFPKEGVGVSWASRFLERHSDWLKTCWSKSLDHSRARAVNPITKKAYFDLLRKAIYENEGKEPIPPELIYGVDETGIQPGVDVSERVIGPSGSKVQHQQCSGDCENITIIVTICADGTASVPPAVIYKGEGYQVRWNQENPLNTLLGHSKKGYTNGEIGVEWIKHFDKHTKEKAKGRYRLLLVDGHNSHYMLGFIEYARANKIHVLCYPSHSTHIYQGLDVVIFSILKRFWTKFRDTFEQINGRVNKTNFLRVYAQAHIAALTPDNIRAAFSKTGVVPFNSDIVTTQMMAPSLQTSSTTSAMPVPLPSPIEKIAQLLYSSSSGSRKRWRADSDAIDLRENQARAPEPILDKETIAALQESASTSFLFTPLCGSVTPPPIKTTIITPTINHYQPLMSIEPETDRERELLSHLQDAQTCKNEYKKLLLSMQASMVLQSAWNLKAQEQLQSQSKAKEGQSKKMFGDGMPKMLSGDEFHKHVQEVEAEAADKAECVKLRKMMRVEKAVETADMKRANAARVERNNERRRVHKMAVTEWEKERDAAKKEGRKAGWTRPRLTGIEKPPKKAAVNAEVEEEEEDGMVERDEVEGEDVLMENDNDSESGEEDDDDDDDDDPSDGDDQDNTD